MSLDKATASGKNIENFTTEVKQQIEHVEITAVASGARKTENINTLKMKKNA